MGFLASRKFCSDCLILYKDLHKCQNSCYVCKRKEACTMSDVQLSCKNCHMTCRSLSCFKSHLQPQGRRKESSCERWWKCVTCMKVVDRRVRDRREHVCAEWLCKGCGKYVDSTHLCYIRALDSKKSTPKFIFF